MVLNSPLVKLPSEVILINNPFASFTSILSNNGLSIACWVASSARSMPSAIPLPIIVEPAFDITLLTSAKSKFISPGFVISSAIPLTALSKTILD